MIVTDKPGEPELFKSQYMTQGYLTPKLALRQSASGYDMFALNTGAQLHNNKIKDLYRKN